MKQTSDTKDTRADHVFGETFITSTSDKVDLIPHFKSHDGLLQSQARWLPSPSSIQSLKYAVWQAEPGTYSSPGGDFVETFVVTHGRGTVIIEDGTERELLPGVIVSIPPKTRSTIVVQESFRKFATFAVVAL